MPMIVDGVEIYTIDDEIKNVRDAMRRGNWIAMLAAASEVERRTRLRDQALDIAEEMDAEREAAERVGDT